MRYKYLGKWPHNLIIRDVKYVLGRGKVINIPERTKLRKVGKRLSKAIIEKEPEIEKPNEKENIK